MEMNLTESESWILLSKRRRRLLLWILHESSTPLSINELVGRIAEREYEDPTVNQQREISLSLYHDHIPRLEKADVVVYNEDDGTIAPYRNFDHLIRELEMMNQRDLPWSSD